MPAYMIVEIEVTDPIVYEEYKKLAPAIVAQYGGKYLARGGQTEVLEGDWQPKRLVILEFANSQQAKTWVNSPEYQQPRQMRLQSTHSHMVLLEGVAAVEIKE